MYMLYITTRIDIFINNKYGIYIKSMEIVWNGQIRHENT
jgi:hypothetical protein